VISDVDVVFHLAALIAIPYSYQAPQSFVETNVAGTLNVLEAARRHSLEKVIVTSTSEVYGTPDTVPITENHALSAQSPYAASKVGADQMGLAYAASFDLNVAILRPFNTYGPRQSMRAVIPTVLAQMLAGQRQIRLGSLHPRRDFTFVSDTVDGFVKTAETTTLPGEVIQLGTGTSVSVGDLIELCRTITGSTAEIIESDERVRPEGSEVQVLLSDPSQALARLGWSPGVSLDEGLHKTSQWVAKHMSLENAARYYR
jgi:UDP-glucose 4-epimerase